MINFTTTVEKHATLEDYYITIPKEVLDHLGWEEGDTLDWQITDSKQIIITKVKDAGNTQQQTKESNDWYTVKYEAVKEYLQDYQEVYDEYIEATNQDTFGNKSIELS